MERRRRWTILGSGFLLLVVVSGSVGVGEEGECPIIIDHTLVDDPLSVHCGLYMAQSTIPGAGLGSFTGMDRAMADVIGGGDVMLPIYDVEYHLQNALGPAMVRRNDWDSIDPTRHHVWYGPDLAMQRESAHPESHLNAIAFGLDAVINCHPLLYNSDKKYPSYDYLDLHRSQDPGTGAFTPYHNASTFLNRAIPAGAELFKDYGDEWFIDRADWIGLIPLRKNYKVIESLLQTLHSVFEHHQLSDEIRRDLFEVLRSWSWNSDSRTMLALPKSYDDVLILLQSGIHAIHQHQTMRTLDDLEANGRCIDNVRPGPSTLRQAGRGAFATRLLANNSIVTGTPFFFFPSVDFFKLHQGNWFTKEEKDFHPDRLFGYQLMYNYCWHPEGNVSSIFLCPYGANINYINHNQSQANLRVQWAPDGVMNHDAALLQVSPAAMYYSDAPPLWLDFVATRDIRADEELFMDYGDVWEAAWTAHVHEWNRDGRYSPDYVSAEAWNRAYPQAPLRTEDEQHHDPYPSHFRMICLPRIADPLYTDLLRNSEFSQRSWKPTTLGLPCRVIDRQVQEEDGSFWYIVLYQKSEDVKNWTESHWIVREAIRWIDAPYSTDLFLESAFRHPVGFPEEVFPAAWRGIFLPPLPQR